MGWFLAVVRRPLGRILVAAVVAVATIVVASLQAIELRRERNQYLHLTKTNYWALGQLPWELERFLSTLDRYLLGVPPMPHDELELRFEILWSRVPVLLQGPETAEVRRIEGAVALLHAFEETLTELEPVLAKLREREVEPYLQLRSHLESYRDPFHGLVQELHHGIFSQAVRERIAESHRRSTLYQVGMLVLLALLILHLVLELVHSDRQARRENAARVAAEAADQAKSNFLAVMGHELRTPLNAIIGFAELMKSELFGSLPERYRSYVHDIHDSGQHLLAVLTSVLDMVKLGSHRPHLQEEGFEPAAVVRASIRQVELDCERAGLAITAEVDMAGVLLWADRRLFQQIVLNLLSNAVKFTPSGGAIAVRLMVEEGGLVLQVADDGPGIAPELLGRIAEPFFQADQSHTRRHEGIGLGLSLVKGFAELHEATLVIDGAPGRGTLATVRFPARRLLPTAPSHSAPPVGAIRGAG